MFLFFTKSLIVQRILLAPVSILVLLLPTLVFSAQVQVEPTQGTYNLGQVFTVTIKATGEGQTANAVEATLQFDPAILEVVSVSKNSSTLSRWTTEPTFSNTAGTISFGGVSSAPFTDSSNLVDITFRALASGRVDIAVGRAVIFATDGLRTDVFTRSVPASLTISSATTSPSTQEQTRPLFGAGQGSSISVNSHVFYDPATWYNATAGTFTWLLPQSATAVAVELTTNPNNRPNNNPNAISEPPITEFVVTEDMVEDGVQYFSIRFATEDGWDEILNRPLLIDTTAPETFSIVVNNNISASGFPVLSFDAVDLTSGIAKYEVYVGDNSPVQLTADEARLGFPLSRLEDGNYTVRVLAYDRAGNVRESVTEVLVTAGWVLPAGGGESRQFLAFVDTTHFSIVLLTTIILLLLAYGLFDRQQMLLKEAKLRKETQEIQAQMEKIFTALRDEIYEQINTITKRKRLTKAEKEAVEGLNQAIEVSEALIEKEINDVKKILD
jgi:hypothetical protein